MQKQEKVVDKVDRNKVYFLIVVIVALLGINGYLYFRDQQQTSRFVTISTEKDRLKLEVEKIEVELDRVNLLNVTLNDRLIEEQKLAREKIAELKFALKKGELTQKELEEAHKQINTLRDFVKSYNNQIAILEQENSYLKSERDSLKTSISNYNEQTENLRKENRNLNRKVKIGSSLKASNILVNAYRVRDNGKISLVTKAGSTNKLTIDFAVVPNDLAEKTYHKVFLRVIDPAGNLIADENNMFEADGQQMQYSRAIEISYNNDDTKYKIDWINTRAFIKGVYGVFLYADGFLMGKSEIELH